MFAVQDCCSDQTFSGPRLCVCGCDSLWSYLYMVAVFQLMLISTAVWQFVN
jgi:hypothetical protein